MRAILTYLPPPGVCNSDVYVQNLLAWKRECQILAFSDHAWTGFDHLVRLKSRVDDHKRDAKGNVWFLRSLIFLTGIRLAHEHGVTDVIWVEADCRVGADYWDNTMFNDFDRLPQHGLPIAAAGMLCAHNPCNHDVAWLTGWTGAVHNAYADGKFPPLTYSGGGSDKKLTPCVFPYGGLSILNVGIMRELFGTGLATPLAQQMSAWDKEIGMRLFDRHGAAVWDMVGQLGKVWSSYGDVLTSEEERLQMLRDGRVVGVHQVKSEATCLP